MKAPAIVIAKGATAGEAFVTVAWSCLNHLAHNEAVFLSTRDPEALHQLRVAARRFRSDFSVFRPVWRMDPAGGRLKADLRAGHSRSGTLLRPRCPARVGSSTGAAASSDPALRAMRERLIREQAVASEQAASNLESVAWKRLVSELTHWVQQGSWSRAKKNPARDRSAKYQARRSLGRLRDRVDTLGTDLAERTPAERHQVRIEGKKLRYGAEFLGSLYPKKTLEHDALIVALQSMQEHLGTLNDLATARTLLVADVAARALVHRGRREAANLSAAVVARAEVLDVPRSGSRRPAAPPRSPPLARHHRTQPARPPSRPTTTANQATWPPPCPGPTPPATPTSATRPPAHPAPPGCPLRPTTTTNHPRPPLHPHSRRRRCAQPHPLQPVDPQPRPPTLQPCTPSGPRGRAHIPAPCAR